METFGIAAVLSADISNFMSGMSQAKAAHGDFTKTINGSTSSAGTSGMAGNFKQVTEESNKAATALKGNLSGALRGVAQSVGLVGGAFALWKTIEVASRAEEMSVALHQLGKNAGVSSVEVDKQTEAIKKMGVTTAVAQKTMQELLRTNIDYTDGQKLARVAQDAAIFSMADSSETLDRMVYGIQQANTEVLRTAGINVQVGNSFEVYANSLGKSANDLTENERAQSTMNAVLEQGTSIAGSYEAAMGTASKQVRSFPRYIEEIQQSIGTAFMPAFTSVIFMLKDTVQLFQELASEGGPVLNVLKIAAAAVAAPLKLVGTAVSFLATNLKEGAKYADQFRAVIEVAAAFMLARAVIGFYKMIAASVLYRIEMVKLQLLQRSSNSLSGTAQSMTMRQVAAQKALEASTRNATGAIAAQNAMAEASNAIKGTEIAEDETLIEAEARLAAARTSARALGMTAYPAGTMGLPGQGGIGGQIFSKGQPGSLPPSPVAPSPTLMGGMGASLASMGPMLAITAAMAGGMALYSNISSNKKKESDRAQGVVDRSLKGEDSPQNIVEASRTEIEQRRKFMKTAAASDVERSKGLGKKIWESGQIASHAIRLDVSGTLMGIASFGQKTSISKGEMSAEEISKYKKEIRDANLVIKETNARILSLADGTGRSATEIKELAKAMGIDIYAMSQDEEKALKANLSATISVTVATGEMADAMGRASDTTKTMKERSQGLSDVLANLSKKAYGVETASRSAQDTILSGTEAYDAAAKKGGSALKSYMEHTAEHNKTVVDSMVSVGNAMRDAGGDAASYVEWSRKVSEAALAAAGKQKQTAEEQSKFREVLTASRLTEIAGFKAPEVAPSVRKLLLEPELKLTEGTAVSEIIKALSKTGLGTTAMKEIQIGLQAKMDYKKMTAAETQMMIAAYKGAGWKVPIEMLTTLVGSDLAVEMTRLFNGNKKERADATRRLQVIVDISASISPELTDIIAWLTAAGADAQAAFFSDEASGKRFGAHGTKAKIKASKPSRGSGQHQVMGIDGPTTEGIKGDWYLDYSSGKGVYKKYEKEGYDAAVKAAKHQADVLNGVGGYTRKDIQDYIRAGNSSITKKEADDNVLAGGSTKIQDEAAAAADAIQKAREARRMATALSTIGGLTGGGANAGRVGKALEDIPGLGERETIAGNLKTWKDDYVSTLAGVVTATSESTARIVASWGMQAEQMKDVSAWLSSIGQSLRGFSSVTKPSALASGRAGNKIEEWVDGLIQLKEKGLNPLLLKQLMEAGPESLGAVRRLLRGDLTDKVNAQYDRITGQMNRIAVDPVLGKGLGTNFSKGIAQGIADTAPEVTATAVLMLEKMVNEMAIAMGIRSPSHVTAKRIGEPMVAGITRAIGLSAPNVGKALQDVVDGVDTGSMSGIGVNADAASGRTIENHFHVAGFVVDRSSVDAMIEAQDWAMRTSGGL